MKYLDFFEEVYYINLDSRIDRKISFEKRSKEFNINAIRFSAINPDFDTAINFALLNNVNEKHVKETFAIDKDITKKVGSTLSHQEVIKDAKKGFKNILIFEDDCVFYENFYDKLKVYVEELKNIEWDIFYLGGCIDSNCEFVSENIAKVYAVYTTHAYAINHTFYDSVLKSNMFPIDLIYKNDSPMAKKYVGSELIAIQDNSFSDLWSYNPIEKENEMKLSWEKYINPKIKKRIIYSIPIHECPECIKQMCDGILYYDTNAIIVLHVSKNSNIDNYKFCEKENTIFINPIQFDTNWGKDFTKVHISNYLYVKDKFSVSYVVFLTSNMLMIKDPSQYIQKYDAGFNDILKEQNSSWFDDINNKKIYLDILKELNSNTKYGSILDGAFVNKYLMDKICYFYNKYIINNFDFLEGIHSPEEKIIPTITCNLTNKISNSIVAFNPNLNIYDYNDIYFVKKIKRNILDKFRIHYSNIIYKK